jgi:hypothetical protein
VLLKLKFDANVLSEGEEHEMSIDPIGCAKLIGNPAPFNDNNMNPTYRGQILTAGDVIKSAFIKDLTQRELGLELLIAALGKLLSLPIPNAYLVLSNKTLPTAIGPSLATGERLLFASEDAATPSLSRFANTSIAKRQSVLAALVKLHPIESLFVLDTWIANVDRNAGNLLVGPNGMWFIDHGQSLGGASARLATS